MYFRRGEVSGSPHVFLSASAGTREGTGLGKVGKEIGLTPSAAVWIYTELNNDIKHHATFPIATVQTEPIIGAFT